MTTHRVRIHNVMIGLGGEGFRAICACGWQSPKSWAREDAVQASADHNRQSAPRTP